MFAPKSFPPARIFRPAPVYPRFGGRPVRRSVSGHPVTVVLGLVGAIAISAAGLPFAGNAAGREAHPPRFETATPVARGEARTTQKADRLVPPPAALDANCDGVWGDEPLECLLQAA
jgi:hypothetical protein